MTPTPAWIDAEAEGIDIATACETLRKVAEGRLLRANSCGDTTAGRRAARRYHELLLAHDYAVDALD